MTSCTLRAAGLVRLRRFTPTKTALSPTPTKSKITHFLTSARGVSRGGTTGYADEQGLAYAAKRNPNDALAAIYRKAPVAADPFAQRWSVWAAGYGGSQTTNGNAVLGSNNTTSNLYGVAVGADYRLSPDTPAGLAPARRATNFMLAKRP